MKRSPQEHIKFLLNAFKVERFVYLGGSVLSFAVIVYCLFVLMKDGHYTTAIGLLVPGGALMFCCTNILKIWNDCYAIVREFLSNPNNE